MKYFVIAGEASGDLHGASLTAAIRKLDEDAFIQAWGGDLMEQEGAVILKHYKELAFMGFVEVIRHMPEILRNLRNCKKQIRQFSPNALILIDYPGFNLRIAKWAAGENIPVFYYISPQLWAWNEKRVEIIRQSIIRMFVILPFEQQFYAKHGISVTYVGHPLVQIIDKYRQSHTGQRSPNTIALLPGSRRQEIDQLLSVYLHLPPAFPDWRFIVAGAKHIDPDVYKHWMNNTPASNVELVSGDSYAVLSEAAIAITTSGTATLETALFDVPEIVCYKGTRLSYQIARRLIKVNYISLVNLIYGEALVRELIQKECNPVTLTAAVKDLMRQEEQDRIRRGYARIRQSLVHGGGAQQAAEEIIETIRQ